MCAGVGWEVKDQSREITARERSFPPLPYSLSKKGFTVPAPQSPPSKSDYDGLVAFSSSAGFLPFGISCLCTCHPSKQQLLGGSSTTWLGSKEHLLPFQGRPVLGSVLTLSPSPKSFLLLGAEIMRAPLLLWQCLPVIRATADKNGK